MHKFKTEEVMNQIICRKHERTDKQSIPIMQKGSCHDVIINPNWKGLHQKLAVILV